MNRRKFIENSAILGTAIALPMDLQAMNKKKQYKLGYQLYSIRDQMALDPIKTLKVLKEMGYEDFEHYGFDDVENTFYGLALQDFKIAIDDMGLSISSGHYNFSPHLNDSDKDLLAFVDKCISAALAIDSKYITWPWLAPELRTLENYRRLVDKLNLIGRQVKAAGLDFAYHNHGFEFEDHDGESGFDIIVSGTDPSLVKLQVDMYWVMHSAQSTPKKLISEQPGRYVMWHIKDMDVLTRDYTELGNGSINYTNVLPDPSRSGLEYFYIEQGGNFTKDSTESARFSAQYFKKHLSSSLIQHE